ncbi:MAG: hypothetical protein Q8P41_05225 [Pseudomonadota bacterium]|nr:hypothetical protein [Pseudomonadota bacterium]
MFSWFQKKPPAPTVQDQVWLTEGARLDALVRIARTSPFPVLFLAFFEDTVETLVARFAAEGLPIAVGASGEYSGTTPRVILADQLRVLPGRLPEVLVVCVAEYHPLPTQNRQLLEALEQRTDARPTFHVALDEPMMLRFGGAKIAELMVRMGLSVDEAIEHPMVSKALGNARDKVATKVRNPRPARSMAAWFAENLGPE